MWAWRAGGVSLSHSTYAQWDETTHIPISQMQPGDLIFYGSDLHHVAMYTGGGMMIEAPHTGANVREVAVRYDGIQGIGRVG
jgi:cell wall-associated NlpC family hydrolase